MKKCFVITLLIFNLCLLVCHAHPGRTDKYGGHTNKSTGEYHYHNADGSITVAPKPTQSETPVKSDDIPEPVTEPNVQSTIVINGKEKPLQSSLTDNTKQQDESVPNKTDKVLETIDENGNTIIYVPKTPPYENINNSVWAFLVILALTGLCTISPIICIILKKIEEKNPSWSIVFHIPYLIFWPPSLIGNLIYKLYNKITPKPKEDFEDYYEDFEI